MIPKVSLADKPFTAVFHDSFENVIPAGEFVDCEVKDIGKVVEVYVEELACVGNQAICGFHSLNILGRTVNPQNKKYITFQITGDVKCREETVNLDEGGNGTIYLECGEYGVQFMVKIPGYGAPIYKDAGYFSTGTTLYLENGDVVDASFDALKIAGHWDRLSDSDTSDVINNYLCTP